MAELINGKIVSENIREKIRHEVTLLKNETGQTPGLAVVLVGENPASKIYVANKHKSCLDVGINSYQIILPQNTTEEELLRRVDELNINPDVHGILVQLPLPEHISGEKVINRILPSKDVDAFHPSNVGKILTGNFDFAPCTPYGIIELLHYYNIEISGKECVILGRSNIVGKPMALLLLNENATVTICHSKTKNIKTICKNADIIVSAVGKPKFVTEDMVKHGAVVVDVGINRDENGKLCGDVDFANVEKIATMITPVPGGVGPMTITMLLKNTVTAFKKSLHK